MKPVAEADAAAELVAVLPHRAGSIIRAGGGGGSIIRGGGGGGNLAAAVAVEVFMRHLLHARTRLHMRFLSIPRHAIPTLTPSPQFPDTVCLRARVWSVASQAAGLFRGGWQGSRWARIAGFWWGGMTGSCHLRWWREPRRCRRRQRCAAAWREDGRRRDPSCRRVES